MEEFLGTALAFPTVVYSIPLLVAGLYWITVIVGVLDVDLLGGADAHADGAIEAIAGKAEGLLHAATGHADGAIEAATGKAEAAAEAATGHADDVADTGLVAFLSALRLRRAPVTVVLTVLALVAWLVTFLSVRNLGPLLPLPVLVTDLLCLGLGFLVAWPTTALVTFPMGGMSKPVPAITNAQLVGRTVVVATSRVDASFGEAELHDGGAGLLLQIRCPSPNPLVKGGEALLVSWDPERGVFDVEPMQALLGDAREG